jgi:hypothetical protein
MSKPWRAVAAALFMAAVCLAQSREDWLIVPGQSVGPVRAGTLRADLPRMFAPKPVEDDEIELDEGIVQPATLVAKDVPSESLAIIWNGKGPDAHPKQIFLCRGLRRGVCLWHTAAGISDRTKLGELEKLNGKPFIVSGFGMNYGGNVQSWDGGKLETLECGGRLTLTLDGERRRGGPLAVELTSEERHSITGDKPVASSTPAMRKVDPAVTEMVFYFPGADSKPCASR